MNHECLIAFSLPRFLIALFLIQGQLNMEFFRVNGTSSNPHTGKMMIAENSDIHEIRGGGFSSSSISITDSLKETMISQEGVLQKQILELHRIYGKQKNLMEKFDYCKKIDNYSLWNASAQSTFSSKNQTRYSFGGEDIDFPAFPMMFSAQSPSRTQYNQVLLQKSPIDLQLNKESSYCDVSTQNPVIDLEEPVDEVSSCNIIERTSCIQGLDLNKQPEDDNSNMFLNSNSSSTGRIDYGNEIWQIDLNSTQSEIVSCSGNSKYLRRNNTDVSISNTMETNNKHAEEDGKCKISEFQIAKSKPKDESIDEKEIGANESNNDPLSRRVVDLGILEAAESLMAMDDDDGEIQPERSLDSYELIVLNLEECSSGSVDEFVVSSEEKVKVKEESPIKLRRGGRRIKDFRKDVLPNMACLSRQEIQEDVNIMESVIKSREYKRIMKAKTTNGGGDKLFTPVKKRSRRSKRV